MDEREDIIIGSVPKAIYIICVVQTDKGDYAVELHKYGTFRCEGNKNIFDWTQHTHVRTLERYLDTQTKALVRAVNEAQTVCEVENYFRRDEGRFDSEFIHHLKY